MNPKGIPDLGKKSHRAVKELKVFTFLPEETLELEKDWNPMTGWSSVEHSTTSGDREWVNVLCYRIRRVAG